MGAFKDLSGLRFGRLIVVGLIDERHGTSRLWTCLCDCGKTVTVPSRHLNNGAVQSCGCQRMDRSKTNLSGNLDEKLGRGDGTNISRIRSVNLQRNNTSGIRGVSWSKQKRGWIAYIYFKGKRYYLGAYALKSDAKLARKAAEAKYFADTVSDNAKTKKSPRSN